MFREYINKKKDEFLNDLFGLLKIDTVMVEQYDNKEAPFGQNLVDALNYCLSLGRKYGFKTSNIDNIVGEIEMGEGDESIGILCHLDVVPTGTGWTTPPFEPSIRDGKLYARGSLDDKGAAIASLYAMRAIKEMGIKLNRKVILILGTNEETGSLDIQRYLEVRPMPTMGFSPDADFPIIYGEKGIMSIDIEFDGKDDGIKASAGLRYNAIPQLATAFISGLNVNEFKNVSSTVVVKDGCIEAHGITGHAMEPRNGVNAITMLCNAIKEYTKNPLIRFIDDKLNDSRFNDLGLAFTDEEMGDLTCNVAILELNQGKGKVGLNLRYPVRWDKDKFLCEITKEASNYGLKVNVLHDSVPLYVSPDSDLIKKLHKAYIAVTKDDKTPLITIGGGTYARYLKNCVAFGPLKPFRENVCHIVNEYICLEDLDDAMEIYAEALVELGK